MIDGQFPGIMLFSQSPGSIKDNILRCNSEQYTMCLDFILLYFCNYCNTVITCTMLTFPFYTVFYVNMSCNFELILLDGQFPGIMLFDNSLQDVSNCYKFCSISNVDLHTVWKQVKWKLHFLLYSILHDEHDSLHDASIAWNWNKCQHFL